MVVCARLGVLLWSFDGLFGGAFVVLWWFFCGRLVGRLLGRLGVLSRTAKHIRRKNFIHLFISGNEHPGWACNSSHDYTHTNIDTELLVGLYLRARQHVPYYFD